MSTYTPSPADIGIGAVILPPVGAQQPIDLTALKQLAQELVASHTLPPNIKTPAQAIAIILAGREMGIEPMLALRSITIDRGKIIIAADLQLAMFKRDSGHAEWVQNGPTGVSLRLRHMNGDEYTSTFTPEDAARAGLWGKAGTWSQYPVAMMRARAITAGLKALGYAPTAGAYDDVSEELPPATPARTRSEATTATSPATTTTPDEPAALLTLCDIDEAIQELAFACREDAKVAASQYAKLKAELEGSEARARRFLARLRRRLEALTAAAAQGTTADGELRPGPAPAAA